MCADLTEVKQFARGVPGRTVQPALRQQRVPGRARRWPVGDGNNQQSREARRRQTVEGSSFHPWVIWLALFTTQCARLRPRGPQSVSGWRRPHSGV